MNLFVQHDEFSMFLSRLLLWCTPLIFTGCAATTGEYCTPPKSDSNNSSHLVIYRPSHYFGALVSVPVSIDGCIIGDLANDDFLEYQVNAGKHIIRAEKMFMADGGDAEISQIFEADKSYYLRYAMHRGQLRFIGIYAAEGEFRFTSKEGAIYSMQKLSKPKSHNNQTLPMENK